MLSLEEKFELAKRAAQKAGAYLLNHRSFRVQAKAHHDFVTECDKASERMIREMILAECPEDDFFGEEYGETSGSGGRWIVDPIDGTTNFIKNLPMYTVSIAYEQGGVLQLGVVYCPPLNELYAAQRGKGATLNGERIRVSEISDPGDAVVSMGFAHRNPENARRTHGLLPALVRELSDLRRMGSAAYDLCCVASGRCDGFFELGIYLYDFAAGRVMVEEAGGKVTGWPGEADCNLTGNVIASNGLIHGRLEELLIGKPYTNESIQEA